MRSACTISATSSLNPVLCDQPSFSLADVSRLFATGWHPRYSLRDGLEQTYAWFLRHVEKGDVRLGAG